MTHKFNALGAYIFAGGFTLGVSRHMNALGHLEDGEFGVPTAKLNFPDMPIWTNRADWPVQEFVDRGDVHLLYANPPCAPWSQAGAKVKNLHINWENDPRTSCVIHAAGVFSVLQPKVYVWESVTQAYTKGKDLIDSITEQCLDLGYAVTHMLTDGLQHGMPQRRRRFLFWAHKVEIDFGPADPQWRTVSQAIDHIQPDYVPPSTEMSRYLWPYTPHGQVPRKAVSAERLQELRDNGMMGKPSFCIKKLHPDEPSNTLGGISGHMHYDEPRSISIAEAKALCGYPQSFRFSGRPSTHLPQMARAVMPPVGDYVGRVTVNALERDQPAEPTVRFIDHLKPAEDLHRRMRKARQEREKQTPLFELETA